MRFIKKAVFAAGDYLRNGLDEEMSMALGYHLLNTFRYPIKYREKVIESTSLSFLGPSLLRKSQLEDFNFSKYASWKNSKFETVMQISELNNGTFIITENLREYS